MRRPELLAPAGNLEKLRTALLYGADAVYAGVPGLSLRGAPAEMSLEDLASGVSEAHAQGVRVYAAVNTFARNADLKQARLHLPDVAATGVDALIVGPSDLSTTHGFAGDASGPEMTAVIESVIASAATAENV